MKFNIDQIMTDYHVDRDRAQQIADDAASEITRNISSAIVERTEFAQKWRFMCGLAMDRGPGALDLAKKMLAELDTLDRELALLADGKESWWECNEAWVSANNISACFGGIVP